jgi:hypothetical protein
MPSQQEEEEERRIQKVTPKKSPEVACYPRVTGFLIYIS